MRGALHGESVYKDKSFLPLFVTFALSGRRSSTFSARSSLMTLHRSRTHAIMQIMTKNVTLSVRGALRTLALSGRCGSTLSARCSLMTCVTAGVMRVSPVWSSALATPVAPCDSAPWPSFGACA